MILGVQLVFDCADPDELMRFWGRALAYDNEWVRMTPDALREWRKDYPQYDGRGRIDDAEGRRMPIYVQAVPEPKAGRNRLRLEVAVRSASEASAALRALGASVEELGEVRDVEGNELTVVEAWLPDGVDRALRSVVFDCLDPDAMLGFWSQATGYVAAEGRCDPIARDDGKLDLVPGLAFVATDEPKRAKNRLHLDLHTSDADAHLAQLRDLGATVQRWDDEHVLLDPEGNELCVA